MRHLHLQPGWPVHCILFAVIIATGSRVACAQLAVSANDGKVMLVDGVTAPRPNPPPDTVSLIDLRVFPPRVIGAVQAPTSVAGPPHSVAIAPNQSVALVTASLKIDPKNPKELVQNDEVSVIDIQVRPPRLLATIHAGLGASGVAINGSGTLALVANRAEGTVSVFTIRGNAVSPAGKVDLQGGPESMPSQVMFTADGKAALVSCNAATDNRIVMLTVTGSTVEYMKSNISEFYAGLRPYGMDITPAGTMAVIASIGTGLAGGVDIVSLVDLASSPPHAISQLAVGSVPEAVAISPDGKYVAVTVMNGTNAAKTSPYYHDFGLLKILKLDGRALTNAAEIKVGRWCQGAAWTANSGAVLVQCMVEQEIQLFRFDGKTLKPAGAIKIDGGPAGIRTSK